MQGVAIHEAAIGCALECIADQAGRRFRVSAVDESALDSRDPHRPDPGALGLPHVGEVRHDPFGNAPFLGAIK